MMQTVSSPDMLMHQNVFEQHSDKNNFILSQAAAAVLARPHGQEGITQYFAALRGLMTASILQWPVGVWHRPNHHLTKANFSLG